MQNKATTTKRVLSLIMAIAMILTLAPLSVFAAETTKTVYFRNDWLWTDVCAYSYDADGNYHAAWPGTAMTFVENDGTYDIYKFEVPADAATIIFNGIKNDNSGARDQSPNITDFADGDAFYMHYDGGNKCSKFTYTPPSSGDDTTTEATTAPAATYD